jgi:hypothetical protein
VTEKIKIKIKRVKSSDILAGLTLFIASVLFFYDLFGSRYLLTERDLAPYFIPPRFFWVESLKGLDFPLWNPYQFSGHPFLGNPQNATLYPLNGFFFLLPFDIAFNVVIVLHFFLAGLFTYIFLRALKTSSTGALISGLTFMLGGYLLSVHSLLTILFSVIWTPMIMFFFWRAMGHPGVKNEILTALFMTLSFLGGGIEVVYGNFFVLSFLLIFSMFSCRSFAGDKSRRCLIMIRSFLATTFSFFILSAFQLLPFIELWMHSIRGQGITYHEATIWSFAPKDILLFFLPDVYGYFLDMKKYWATQCWLKTMYTGGLPFILSLIFFLAKNVGEPLRGLPLNGHPQGAAPTTTQRDEVKAGKGLFLALMFSSLFLSLGQYNPLYPFVYQYVPFFNGIRYPVKFLYIFILCLAITAGLGFEKLRQFSKEEGGKTFKHLLMGFSLLSGLALLFFAMGHEQVEYFLKARGIDFPDFNHLSTNLHHAKRFFFYLTLFFLLFRVGYEVGWKGWVKIALVFFLITDLFGNMGFYGKEKTEDYFKKTRIIEIATMEKGAFRIFSTPKTISLDTPVLIGNAVPFDLIKEKHIPSFNMIFQVHDIWGIDVVRLKRTDDLYKKFISLPSISSGNLIDLYGVKYVISLTKIEDPDYELIYARLEGLEGNREDLLVQPTIKLYRNKNPVQRARLLKEFRVMDSQAILSTLAAKEFQPDKMVLLEEIPPFLTLPLGDCVTIGETVKDVMPNLFRHLIKSRPYETLNQVQGDKIVITTQSLEGGEKGGGEMEFLSESNNRLLLKVKAEERCILVLSDTYYPGWKVFVNGKREKILRANYNFRAVVLPKGGNRVEFVYSPFSFRLGMGMTLGGILVCGALWWRNRKKETRKSPDGN